MMSVVNDKVFEDQIERMKLKNQMILEKFQASEEDRKLAEISGSTINKKQNVQIRVREGDKARRRKQSNPPQRPKSFHDGQFKQDVSNQLNEPRQRGKLNRNQKTIDDEIAYQDYFHFQQLHRNKPDQYQQKNNNNNNDNNRLLHHQNSVPARSDNNYNYTTSYRDYTRSKSQKVRTSAQFNQNYVSNIKPTKVIDPSIYKLDNTKPSVSSDSQQRVNHFNTRNKSKTTLNNCNNQNIDPAFSRYTNSKTAKNAVFDDEYIDDTLEDLEKYRLKVDMDDFIVIDPESPNPILAMPLTPWTHAPILTELSVPEVEGDCKHNGTSDNLLNNVNERAKDYLNLVNQSNIDNLSSIELKCNEENSHCLT